MEDNSTSSVYRLSDLITTDGMSAVTLDLLLHDVVDAIAMRHQGNDDTHGHFTAETIAIDLSNGNIQISTVGDGDTSEADDIADYGKILAVALATHSGNTRFKRIADDCIKGEITTFYDLSLRIERHISNTIYIPIIIIIASLISLLYWANLHFNG